MMRPRLRDITSEIEAALKSVAKERGDEIAIKIRPVLFANLDRGRIHGFTEGNGNLVSEYVWRVANHYELLSTFIHKLQVERSDDVWGPLFLRMEKWAYNFLKKESYNISTLDNATDCATEAAELILNAHFPYDVDFDPWAHVVVQHACQKYVRRIRKKTAVPEENLVPLDEMLENFMDPVKLDEIQLEDLRRYLLEAIERLPDSRREVVELHYFRGLSPKEIAQKMKKSVGAVYSLHFNALQDLQKILSENRDKFNEQQTK